MSKKIRGIIDLCVLALFIILAIVVTVKYAPVIKEVFTAKNPIEGADKLKNIVLAHGNMGAIVMIGICSLQVVIAGIPGNLVQFGCGMIYGVLKGFIIAQIGIALGTMFSFYISRILGVGALELFCPRDKIKYTDKSDFYLLLLYVVPGFPKDFIAYYAGLTKINPTKLLCISAIGRIPGILTSTYMGHTLMERNYFLLVTVTVLTTIPLGIYYLKKRNAYKQK